MTRSCMVLLGAIVWLWVSGCAPHYAYRFDVERPSANPDVTAALELDPTGARDLTLALTNRSPEPVQVAWTRVTLTGPAGRTTLLRPEEDQGFIPAGATVTARLSPFTLPDLGDAAKQNDGARFILDVPMTVRREQSTVRFALAAHVSPVAAR